MSDFFPGSNEHLGEPLERSEWPPRERPRTQPVPTDREARHVSEEDKYKTMWVNRFTALAMGFVVSSLGICLLSFAVKFFRWVTGL